jgi:hypothetical protein
VNGNVEWVTVTGDKEVIESGREPGSSEGRKIEADLAQPLTPESQM